jgi:hypothetical protein
MVTTTNHHQDLALQGIINISTPHHRITSGASTLAGHNQQSHFHF